MKTDQFVTHGEVAIALSISKGTLSNWRVQRIGLRFVRAGKRVFYLADDVEAFKARHFVIVDVRE